MKPDIAASPGSHRTQSTRSGSDGLHPGELVRLVVQGSQKHSSEVTVVSDASPATLQVRMSTGKTINIPRQAILSVTPIARERAGNRGLTQNAIAREIGVAIPDNPEDLDYRRLRDLEALLLQHSPAINAQRMQAKTEALAKAVASARVYLEAGPDTQGNERRRASALLREVPPGPRYKTSPGRLAYELERLRKLLSGLLNGGSGPSDPAAQESPPSLATRDVINVTREINNEFDLPLRLTLDSTAQILTDVVLHLDKFRNLRTIGAAPVLSRLEPGETQQISARMRDNRKQGQRGEIRIEAHVQYRDQQGKKRESPRQTIRLNIFGKEVHQEIPNPFRTYASGVPVTSAEMFFGRQPLVDEFVVGLQTARGGVCYALYGQQRTGKSSVLHQVQSRLREQGAVVATMSMGTMDRHSMTLGFVEEVLDQFRVEIDSLLPQELSSLLFAHWPDASAIERRPLRSLQRAIEAAKSMLQSADLRPPFVVIVDEFTYLFEILRRDGIDPREHNELRDFMRQLKSLLEAGRFSALLSGQDTMPRFLEAFPNEFSVMATRKLDYLTGEETKELADLPLVASGDSSRYTGYALDTLASYTDGHPFFTQILCDRIVTLVNEKRRSRITESDVEEAVESLLGGVRAIEPHRFDCLISADNSHELISDIEVTDDLDVRGEASGDGWARAQAVLLRLALISGSQNILVHVDELGLDIRESEALDDLRVRGVLNENDEGMVKIRVLLYADYLRRVTW